MKQYNWNYYPISQKQQQQPRRNTIDHRNEFRLFYHLCLIVFTIAQRPLILPSSQNQNLYFPQSIFTFHKENQNGSHGQSIGLAS